LIFAIWSGGRKAVASRLFARGSVVGGGEGQTLVAAVALVNLNTQKNRQLNALFALKRRVIKAYLLKESLDRLWSYTYEGSMLRYLKSWIDQLRWQRLKR
jgi:Transposase